MATIRVEGVLNHIRVHVEWVDGQVSGDAVFVKLVEQTVARGASARFYEDPLAFAAIASSALERYSDAPVHVNAEGITDALVRGMEGVVPEAPAAPAET